MIRHVRPQDFPRCLEMAREFWALTGYDAEFDDRAALLLFDSAAASGLFLVLDDDGVRGMILGLKSPLLCNRFVEQVTELAWWMDPAHRGRGGELLDAFEIAARRTGARYLNMAALAVSMADRLDAAYVRRGYRRAEALYTKEL